jgi:hypothetical protein
VKSALNADNFFSKVLNGNETIALQVIHTEFNKILE